MFALALALFASLFVVTFYVVAIAPLITHIKAAVVRHRANAQRYRQLAIRHEQDRLFELHCDDLRRQGLLR